MTAATLRLVSWNVGGRTGYVDEQFGALKPCKPDIIALQEVRGGNMLEQLRDKCTNLGLPHIAETTPLTYNHERTYGVLIASRWPQTTGERFNVPQPERILSVNIQTEPWGPIEVTTIHVPPGSKYYWEKIETFEGLYDRLARISPHPRILCGDLNAPQAEREDGELITFGQDIDKEGTATLWDRWHGDTGARWDRGERLVLTGLAAYDLPDTYRQLHGYAEPAHSHIVNGKLVRYDHLFASRSLNPVECGYRNDWREQRLSDHAAMVAVFEPKIRMHSNSETR